MRVLITGSRDWTDRDVIEHDLRLLYAEHGALVIVHGCADGADSIADAWAARHGNHNEITVERHPADWATCAPTCRPEHRQVDMHGDTYCPAAGIRRNAAMVAAGADLCRAFIKDGSKGATTCARLAERAGIPTRRFLA
jgi:hypothetical protein